MQTALDTLGIGNEWYPEPAGLVHKGGAYYLPGTK
jgi:hypothetical protein